MPTTTEASSQYLPRQQRYHYDSKTPDLDNRNTPRTKDSVVKSIDVTSLIEVTSASTSRWVWITIAVIVGCCIVAAAIIIPVVLTLSGTITSTSTASTTTTYPYPSGIALLSPSASLLNISAPSSSSSYFNISWLYYAQGYNETIAFGIQNNPSYTEIDDVSVLYGTEELLCNGGFENASMICWQGANHLSTGNPHTGSYCYNDGVVGAPDYVWQTFSTVPGALLYISFWIAWGGSGGGVYTNVTIYP